SLSFFVVSEPDENGAAILSHLRAGAWQDVVALHQSKATESVLVKSLVSPRGSDHISGAIVEIRGLRGFVPASQLSTRGKAMKELRGKTIQVKVLEAQPEENNLLLSQRAAAAEHQAEFFANAKVGQIVRGTVTSFGTAKEGNVKYGAFIDLGNGISGLLHRSEINFS